MIYRLPALPPINLDESKKILRKLTSAHRNLAELKGIATSIPNESILIDTLTLQEAKYSSEIENIITSQDALFQQITSSEVIDSAAKEVSLYADALKHGFNLVKKNKIITVNHLIEIHSIFMGSKQGLRTLPGTKLINPTTRETVYTPPQDAESIRELMDNLMYYINTPTIHEIDPLVKMAVAHFQFESIHPFYDGNGRVGRILNVLFLVISDLLRLPILYLSRYIIRNKSQYYTLLRELPQTNNWEPWVLYMLDAVEETSRETIILVNEIRNLMSQYKSQIRTQLPSIYSQDLINNLFRHPYTKIEFVMRELGVQRKAASKYLNLLVEHGFLIKNKVVNTNYYINAPLYSLFAQQHDESKDENFVETLLPGTTDDEH